MQPTVQPGAQTLVDNADHPKHRTGPDGSERGRACLLILGSLIMPMHCQVHQPGWSGPEATGIEVEPRQALGEVDVKPLATCRLGMPDSMTHQGGANALPLMLTGDLGIEQEGVIGPVPRHVYKANQAATTL